MKGNKKVLLKIEKNVKKKQKADELFLNLFAETCLRIFENFIDITAKLNKRAKLHGIDHFVNKRYHPLERLLWFTLVIAAFYCVFYIGNNQMKRYKANPTVISLERDYQSWNGTIPALTFCYHNRIDVVKAQYLIKRLWNIDLNDVEYSYFFDYISTVVNASISSFKIFDKFARDRRLEIIDMAIITKDVHPNINSIVSGFDPKFNPQISEVMTEKGICYSVNAILESNLLGTKLQSKNMDLLEQPFTCLYKANICFMKLEVFDPTVQYSVHSPYDIVTKDSQFETIGATDEVDSSFNIFETIASPSLRSLTVSQRNCHFYDESIFDFSGYNVNICRLKCRAEAALKLCGCRPHFYTFINGTSCTPSGLVCLSLKFWPRDVTCTCLKTCSELVYTKNSFIRTDRAEDGEMSASKKKSSSLRYEIIAQKIRYKRDVLFSFEDLIVSFGGTAALFLGYNFWNTSEMFYYIISATIKYLLETFYERSSFSVSPRVGY